MSAPKPGVFNPDAFLPGGTEPSGGNGGNGHGLTQAQQLGRLNAPVRANYAIPDPYVVNGGGVWKITVTAKRDGAVEENVVLVASRPCLITGVLRDEDGDELVELAWRHYGAWRRKAVPRAVVCSGRRLVTALGDAGFPIMDSSARMLEKWLDAVEGSNRDDMPVTTIARVLGWQHDGTFVVGHGRPYQVHPRITGQDKAVEGHQPHGTLEQWQAVIAHLAGHPVAQMGLYAALAAPLLDILGRDSFVLDYSGETTTGKTTSLEVSASVWGDPNVIVAGWNTTRAAAENRLAIVRGIPVCIDETSNAPTPELVRDLLYSIPQNRAKARGAIDGSRPTLTWKTIVITTGERSILSFSKDAGTAARVLELAGSPLGPEGAAVADAVKSGVYEQYGTAGPAFAARLTDHLKQPGARDTLLAIWRKAASGFATGTSLNRRRAPMVAALWTAATLARQYGILPFDPPPVDVWRELFARQEAGDDRPGEALQVLRNWAASNPRRILGWAPVDSNGDPQVPALGWAGKALDDGGLALLPEVVDEVLTRNGYELDAVKGPWGARGDLRRNGRDLKRPVRFNGRLTKCFVFEAQSDPPTGRYDTPES